MCSSVFSVLPVQASMEVQPTLPMQGFLNADGTLKLDGNIVGSFQPDGWNVALDPERGPVLTSTNETASSMPAMATIPGSWSALGSNLAGTDGALSDPACSAQQMVTSMAVSGTDVYVAGCFINAGGDPTADYVAKWDALTGNWSGLGDDGAATPDGAIKGAGVRAIAVNGNDVYIGGSLNTWVGGVPAPQATYLAKWDGTSWSGLGDDGAGGSSINSIVTAIAIDGNNVYVGGAFTNVKNGLTTLTEADYVAKWDTLTGNWSALGNNGSGNGALAGGIEVVQAIAILGSSVYVGGTFQSVYNGLNLVPDAIYIARWYGSSWSALGSRGVSGSYGPISGTVNAITAYGTDLYVAGQFTNITQNGVVLTAADHVAKWDGAYWSALGSNGSGDGALNGSMTSIVVNGSSVYVAGGFTDVNNNGVSLPAADYVAKWNGTNWSALGSNGSGDGALNLYARALGLVGDQLFVGGDFTNVNNNGAVVNNADYIASYNISDGVDLYRVTTSGSSTPDCGTDWATPCDLQYALTSLVSTGDEVWVAAGTYKPTATTDRMVSFTLMNGVAIYGGFAGTETLRTQRDPSTNVTILSGEIGAAGIADNSYHVVLGTELDQTAVLDGFTITAGNSDEYNFDRNYCIGGGMFLFNANPTLSNLVFSGNTSLNGGGLLNWNSSPVMTHITFSDNSGVLAGGMYNYVNSNPTMTDVIFSGNFTIMFQGNAGLAGGMLNDYSSPNLTNVTFSNNTSDSGGGGMYNRSGNPTLTNVTFSNNSAVWWGGGMINDNSNPTLTNVTFSGNSLTKIPTPLNGGGMYNNNNSSPTLKNVIIANSPAGGDCVNYFTTLNAASANNLIEDASNACGLTNGVNGNIIGSDPNLGPLADNGGFTQTMALLAGSPAIDTGNDGACPSTDQRGVTRPQGSHCDIGAYEFDHILYVKWNAGGTNDGSSWTNAFTDLQSALSAAPSGDEIWVAAGTYKPTATTDRTISFVLKNGVGVYGGFAGTEILRTQRDPTVNVTILSGDLNGNDNTNISYDESTRAENSIHVITGNGLDSTSTVDGFTILGGNANTGVGSTLSGGGMYNLDSSPSLSNLIFTANSAANVGGGGGMFNDNSNPTLMNVTFENNSARDGGGMFNANSNPDLVDVTLDSNFAYAGGGIYNFQSNPVLTNVTFGNNSVAYGGAIYNVSSNPTLTNVTINSNPASNAGGGMYNYNNSSPTLKNVIIANNNGGDCVNDLSSLNAASTNNLIEDSANACSLINGVNGNIIGSDPQLGPLQNNGGFTQTMALGVDSSAIDTGNDANCPSTDQRGVTRPQGSHCDIGAYEAELLTVTADSKSIVYGDPDPAFTFQYSGFLDGDTSSVIDTPPTCSVSGAHTNAGSYPIHCSGGADNKYTFVYVDGTLTINKATPVLSVTNSPVVYDGSPHAATVTGSAAGSASNILTGGVASKTNAGTYAVTANFTPSDTTNYSTLTNASAGNFVINKATPVLSVTNSPITYDGSPHAATVTGSVAGSASNILTGGVASKTNAGTYAVTANFTPSDTANYSTLTNASAGNFVINKATPVLSVTNSPITYDGSPHAATVTGSVAGSASNILTGGVASKTNAGTYAVTANFTPTDTTNYNTLTNASAGNFVIDKATPTLSVTNSPITYDGSPHSAAVTGSVAGSVSNILTGGAASQTNAGTYAVTANFTPDNTNNYTVLTNASAGNFVILNGFYISGRKLLDGRGNNFIMRGINHGHNWYLDETSSFANIKAKGANTVRVVLSSGQSWPKDDATDVANVISLCKANKLVCVLEVHDTTGYGEDQTASTLTQAVTYWKEIKNVLIGQEAYVIINIGNEPYGNNSTSNWIADTENAIAELRSAGLHHTLMVDAPNWGQDWEYVMRDNAASVFNSDPDKNILFSVHMYEVFNTATKVQNYVASFVNANLPLVIGEFGDQTDYGNPDEDAIMSVAQANGIGYLGWVWSIGGALDMVNNFNPNQETAWGTRFIHGVDGIARTSCEASIYGSAVEPRVCSIIRLDPNPSSSSSIHFNVLFSNSVTGVGTSDFGLTTSGVSGATISGLSGSGSVYTVTVNTGSGNGTIRLDVVDDDSIEDGNGNPLGGVGNANGNYSAGEAYQISKPSSLSTGWVGGAPISADREIAAVGR